jgi:hypothetical protein
MTARRTRVRAAMLFSSAALQAGAAMVFVFASLVGGLCPSLHARQASC